MTKEINKLKRKTLQQQEHILLLEADNRLLIGRIRILTDKLAHQLKKR